MDKTLVPICQIFSAMRAFESMELTSAPQCIRGGCIFSSGIGTDGALYSGASSDVRHNAGHEISNVGTFAGHCLRCDPAR
jgi:hypothetical protein